MIKLGTQTAGIMLVTGNADLSPISLLDTDPIDPVSRTWSVSYFPDNLASAPAVTGPTNNPASFTPPAAGEWYVIRLVRTLLLSVNETLELPICIPDSTGAYALPPPGIPADVDPAKTIVNLNDKAKKVGWSGSVASGVPGLSGAVRKSLSDSATATALAQSALTGVTGAYLFVALGDDLATAESVAAGRPLVLAAGTHITAAWSPSTNGLTVRGPGKGVCTIKLSTAAADLITITGDDVSISGVTFDSDSKATDACVKITGLRAALNDCKYTNTPHAIVMGAGASVDADGVQIGSISGSAIKFLDTVGMSEFSHVRQDSSTTTTMLEQAPGSSTARKFVSFEMCEWASTVACMVLSCQQPIVIRYNAFNTDATVTPTATFGVERIVSSQNSFEQSGAIGYSDGSGSATTYDDLFSMNDYLAP